MLYASAACSALQGLPSYGMWYGLRHLAGHIYCCQHEFGRLCLQDTSGKIEAAQEHQSRHGNLAWQLQPLHQALNAASGELQQQRLFLRADGTCTHLKPAERRTRFAYLHCMLISSACQTLSTSIELAPEQGIAVQSSLQWMRETCRVTCR